MNAQEFNGGNSLNQLVIHAKAEVGKGIFLGRNDHELSLAGIGSELVAGKPVVDGVNVCLETGDVVIVAYGFVEGGVICIKDQRTVVRKRIAYTHHNSESAIKATVKAIIEQETSM